MGDLEKSNEPRHFTLPLCEFRRLSAILGVALVLRAIVAGRTAAIFNDGPRFLRIAQDLHRGDWDKGLSDAYHPLYSLLIQLTHVSLSSFSIPSWEIAAVGCSVVAGSLAVVPLYAFVRCAFDPRAAWIAALALAVHPYAVRFSADVQSDAVYLLFFLSAVAIAYHSLAGGRGAARVGFAVGVASGLAYLTRPEGIVVPVVALVLWGASMARADRASRIGWRWLAAMLGGTALFAAPYSIALRRLTGSWQVSQKKSVFELLGVGDLSLKDAGPASMLGTLQEPLFLMLGVAALLAGAFASARWLGRPAMREFLWRRAAPALAAVSALALLLWLPAEARQLASVFVSTLRPELLVLVVLGLASLRGTPHGTRAGFVSVFLVVHTVMFVGLLLSAGYLDRRHALPPLVLLFGWAGAGVAAAGRAIAAGLERHPRIGFPPQGGATRVTLAVALAMVAIGLPKSLADHRAEERAGRRAAEWLSAQLLPAGRVAALRSKMAYYAEREWVPLITGETILPLSALQSGQVRYVIAEADSQDRDLDPIEHLRDAGGREVFQVEVDGRQAFVFELASPPGTDS